MTRTGVPHARPSEVLTTSCLLDEAVEARKSDAHIASANFYTSREPRLSPEMGISRSTDRERVTRYSHKRSKQRPEAWLPQTQTL